jgi:hypothetical protein
LTGGPTILRHLKAAPGRSLLRFLKLIQNHLALAPSTYRQLRRDVSKMETIKATARISVRHSDLGRMRSSSQNRRNTITKSTVFLGLQYSSTNHQRQNIFGNIMLRDTINVKLCTREDNPEFNITNFNQ